MLILTVTTTRGYDVPAIIFNHLNYIPYLHRYYTNPLTTPPYPTTSSGPTILPATALAAATAGVTR